MNTKSTLFYGIFADAVQLTIATTIYFDFINIYDPLILELTNNRASHNLESIPLEICNQIKKELKIAITIKLKVDFVTFLACDCCKAGLCSNIEPHRDKSKYEEHSLVFPRHSETSKTSVRECCYDTVETLYHGSGPLGVEDWMNSIGFSITKLELFLAFFNLKLIDPIMIGTYEIFVCSFAIGASQTVSLDHSIRSSDLRNGDLSHCIATFSTPILRNFGYDTYDSAFKNLNDVYGVSSIDSEHLDAYGANNDSRESNYSDLNAVVDEDESLLPAWHSWIRAQPED